jgi:predicted aspartyl protease
MAQFPYDTRFSPPAPVIELSVSAPGQGGKSVKIRGLIDSGADLTVLPENIVTEVGLQYVDEVPIGGFDGTYSVRPIYAARLALEDGWSIIVRAVCIQGDIALLGRDIINRWRLLLDGRAQSFEIS